MSRYLNVSKEKLQSKGVDSVRSRVANLREFRPDLTVALVAASMRQAFGDIYQLPVTDFDTGRLDEEEILRSEEYFASWEWKYGRTISFQHELSHRYAWGDIQIQLDVNGGIIQHAKIYSDSMDFQWVSELELALLNQRYEQKALLEAMNQAPAPLRSDLQSLILESI
jgi:lipoate-protein ligase A